MLYLTTIALASMVALQPSREIPSQAANRP
jgi:hypothetical protein